MRDLLIKNAVIVDKQNVNLSEKNHILIRNGILKEISPDIKESTSMEVLDIKGNYLSQGWIDMHSHISVPGLTRIMGIDFGVDILDYGVKTGVSTMLDAGTFGADNIQKAIDFTESKDTTVYFLINAARTGLRPLKPELEDLSKIDIDAAQAIYEKNQSLIVGVKARASKSATGKSGFKAIVKSKDLANALELPMIVHIGHAPPQIEEVLGILSEGDIITHCFHGKLSNAIVDENYKPRKETLMARDRGVLFDIGHGSESFNYHVAEKLFEAGFLPDIISTDLHSKNKKGPVFSLPMTVDKFITLNDSILPWVDLVTSKPREAFHLSGSTKLAIGEKADLVIFDLVPTQETYSDSDGNAIPIEKKLLMKTLIKGEKRINIHA